MSDLRFRCPHCGAKHVAAAEMAGLVAACFECKAEFTIPSAPPEGVPIPPTSPDGDKRVKELESTLAGRDREIEELKNQVAVLGKERDAAAKSKSDVESGLGEATKSAAALKERIAMLEKTNAELSRTAAASAESAAAAKALELQVQALTREKEGMLRQAQDSGQLGENLKKRVLQATEDFEKLRDENLRLSEELEKVKAAKIPAAADSSDKTVQASVSNRALEDLKRQCASLSIELNARGEELVKVKAERDQALALAQKGGEGTASRFAEQLSVLNKRMETLERVRADQEAKLADYKRRAEELGRENVSLNSRLRTFSQALKHKA